VVGDLGVPRPEGRELREEGVEVDIRRLGVPPPGNVVLPAHHVRAGLDKGVRGIDSVRGIGGSEPTLPKRREKVGTTNNCQL